MTELSPPRFLITRLSAVGDLVHTLPVACALKRYFPGSHVGWVVQGGAAALLEGHSAVDTIHRVQRGWLKRPRQVMQLRHDLQKARYDFVLDPQSLAKSAAAGWLSGCTVRIGFSRPVGREFAPWLHTVHVAATKTHVVAMYLELLESVAVAEPKVEFQLPRRGEAIEFVGRELMKLRLLERPFVVLNPGAGWDSKRWPIENYAAVAQHLGEEAGVVSLITWAGERERVWAEEIVARSGGRAVMAPSTTLPQLAEVMRQATLCLGSDTGPLHLAAAVGTRCLGLYGPTRPEVCGPYGSEHRTLQVYLQQGGSSERRGVDNHAMRAIRVDSVVACCLEMLQESLGSQAEAALLSA